MAPQPQSPARLAFGPFEVNVPAGELRKGGVRIRLSSQPFQILLILLTPPGDVVTREQLREGIWSEGTFVDFEHGLDAAMNKLRGVLGDSADNPRYIETLPRRGYRFLGSVASRRFPLPALRPSWSLSPARHRTPGNVLRRMTSGRAGAGGSRLRCRWCSAPWVSGRRGTSGRCPLVNVFSVSR